jgi:hypothetical protein
VNGELAWSKKKLQLLFMNELAHIIKSGEVNLSTVTQLEMHMKDASVDEKRQPLILIKNKTIA